MQKNQTLSSFKYLSLQRTIQKNINNKLRFVLKRKSVALKTIHYLQLTTKGKYLTFYQKGTKHLSYSLS